MVLKMAVPSNLIGGDVDEGYGPVADAFRANFTQRGEIGASVAVYRDAVKVVDLWGGYRNGLTKSPWQRDTIVNMFSTTKGVAALTVAVAASQGLIDFDATVAHYWPDFAQNGKGEITVRQLLSHQAGLSALTPVPGLREVADVERLSQILAAQAPSWPPGSRHGYHGVTLGWYESELIRHADPAGRTLGRFFADEVAKPLDLDIYIGLPESVDRSRIARIHDWHPSEMLLHVNTLPAAFAVAMLNRRTLSARSFYVPSGLKRGGDIANRDEFRVVEIPAGNGIGNARSVAKMYGCAAIGGAELGLTAGVLEALTRAAVEPTDGLRDKVLHYDTTFSLGYSKPVPHALFGSSERAFGTPGAGGSLGFADPDTGVGFAYVMNRMGFHLWGDPRELALRQALFHDVLGARPQT
jgi:CubicO group peptidase (beta-lactamase class C family)